ncbi:pyridoxamine 5'-phosphate oxidase-like protein [Branchiibius hedensis]|uniref:Pyridoxamine 5'-phosphate oxidase n=1 Tax=Branchiibius hedensis TaxID=672460 RepID=A0A2Y8ZZJ0_9MICO|nr:pyridoxamine 5'-phosphate oxidase family protein [Branchiibius hedensis]PWJ26515.1 pyridoxamine 5'-phosphate oxidase-like protein [Branchiibius hedensis]SSA35327.1 Pyridoxamine 5'-phosphate oxidase [Branchiibius hedensis]
MDENPIAPMSDDEAWEVLRQHEFGRLAFHLLDEVHIVPINYAVDANKRIIFRTAEGSKLLGMAMNSDVAFEIDQYDEETALSVIARGRAVTLEGSAAYVADDLPLRPWVPTAKFNVVAIEVSEISGRRFHLDKPWTHMHLN